MAEMIPNKPYLIRAFYQWIVDSDCIPYLMLNTKSKRVEVPRQFVRNNCIVLDISPGSVRDLELDNDYIYFMAIFKGVEQKVYAPIQAVIALYPAEDHERGIQFPEEPIPEEPPKENSKQPTKNPSHLKIVE